MSDLNFINLNNKTHYSCGLAIGTCKQLAKAAKEKDLLGFAITDHNTIAGLLDAYKTGTEDCPAVLGLETFFFDDRSFKLRKIVLLAKNQGGYINLCKIITTINRYQEYGESCRISLHELSELKDGLFCLCSNYEDSFPLKNLFGDDLYYEIILDSDQASNNRRMLLLHPDRCVITCDSYIIEKEDKVLQDIMITNTKFGDTNQCFDKTKYLMSLNELVVEVVSNHNYISQPLLVHCLNNIKKIFDVCSKIELKFKDQVVSYPHLLHPLNNDSCDKETLLRRMVDDYGLINLDDPIYKRRLEYEIATIKDNGRVNLIDYFLVVEDFCRFCRVNDIPVGPGRGSGAGSLINYALKITGLDPIKYDLLFERFISEGRIQKGTLPDIDLDFADQEPVRVYLTDLYGEDRVLPIGTFQTLQAKGALKDAFRALYPDVPFYEVNAISNKFPTQAQGEKAVEYFERSIEESEVVRLFLEKYPKAEPAIKKLCGFNRQPGVHPCGLAITQDPLHTFMPIRYIKGKRVLEYTADFCEQSGVIKYDILGLKTLRYFQMALRLINKHTKLELYDIPLDDELTYEAFNLGDTTSVFQFNSEVAINILTQITSDCIDDLSMTTSVGRPGTMANNQHNEFIGRKNRDKKSTAPHPAIEELLKDTYGIMIYQESVMKTAEILGGFTLAEADDIRKAMGKKKKEVLDPYKDRFIKYALANHELMDTKMPGNIKLAEHIWNLMETFSGYGFNKSHSISYTLIGYYCQYLKIHYPLEWWCACMHHSGDSDKLRSYFARAEKITQLPDVNTSTSEYYINDGKIIMPFSCVKGIGEKATQTISEARPFTSFSDFFKRVNKRRANKRVIEQLIFAKAFQNVEPNKDENDLLKEFYVLRKQKLPKEYELINQDEIVEYHVKALDFMVLDYVKVYPHIFNNEKMVNQDELSKVQPDSDVIMCGKITDIKKRKVSKGKSAGKEFAIFKLENKGQSVECIAWPEEYGFHINKIKKDMVCQVSGKVKTNYSAAQLTIKNIITLDTLRSGI